MIKEYLEIWRITKKSKRDIKNLKSMEFNADKIHNQIKDSWFNYKIEMNNDTLRKMPVDKLAEIESAMPIKTLKDYGLYTISDCLNKNQEYFSRFPGIGEVKSNRIVAGVEAIKRAVFDELEYRIIKNRSSNKLLKSLFTKINYENNKSEIEVFNQDKQQKISHIKENLNLANKKKFILPWIFSKDKTSINQSVKTLSNVNIEDLSNTYDNLQNHKKSEFYEEDFSKNSISYYSALENTINIKLDFKKTYMSDHLIEKVENIVLNTDELIVSPRPYQYFGAQYMISQKKTLIGDEMGLGKTIEALVAMNHLYQEEKNKHFVVIAPLSVITNWKRETEKWTVLRPFVFHGNNRHDIFSLWLELGGVLITTYGHAKYINLENQKTIDMLIVDEAHYVKNPKAQRSKSVYDLGDKSRYITYMSGTPLENKVEEMVQLISKLHLPIARKLENSLAEFNIRPKSFRKHIAPVYLRRNRKDVLSELPDLEEVEYWLPFGYSEINHYKQAIQEGNFMRMRRSAWTGGAINKSPKLNALVDICNQAKSEGHKILIFSFFRDVLNTIENTLADRSCGQINGDISSLKRQEMIDNFEKSESGSVLISQIMAGGVGLNIQSANIVIICEPQYKPSTEEQAISRSYRMGQTKDVIVYRLLTEESVDERILTILHDKKEIFRNFAKDSVAAEKNNLNIQSSDKNVINQILELEAERYGLKMKKE